VPSFDFDAARRERLAGYDPIQFRLGGEDFVARPAIPFGLIAHHLADPRPLNDKERYEVSVEFIRSCLPDDDSDRLDRALMNPDEPVTEEEPFVVLAFLVGCYVGRPTNPPADSPAGRPKDGGTSKAKLKAASATRGKPRRGGSSTGSKVA
jgi:hypothetical protein